jgi:hypothetical protein
MIEDLVLLVPPPAVPVDAEGDLSRARPVDLLRDAPAVPWFEPHLDRTHLYIRVNDGGRPYVEQLADIRAYFAPTADRLQWYYGDDEQRQDEFKAVDRN